MYRWTWRSIRILEITIVQQEHIKVAALPLPCNTHDAQPNSAVTEEFRAQYVTG
jgi:hypothetical protein